MLRAAGLAVILFGIATSANGQPATDRPDGRVEKLIAQLSDNTHWRQASEKLRKIGRPAVRPLLARITSGGEGIQDTPLNRRALQALGSMGPVAKTAYPELVQDVGSCEPEIYMVLLRTLADLVPYTEDQGNEAAWPTLVQTSLPTIQAIDEKERRRWSVELARFRARLMVDPDAGLEAMLDELKHNKPYRREVAAEVLGRMGPGARKAISGLARALRGRTAIKAGGRLGGRQVFVGGTTLRGEDDFSRRAAEAMIQIAPDDPRSAVAYGYRLTHAHSAGERAQAALAIGSFGKAAKNEVRTLIVALADKSHRVRCETITALGMIGPEAKAAIPRLAQLAESDDKAVAVRAEAALGQIRGR